MTRLIVLPALVALLVARPAAADEPDAPASIPLCWTFERRLPLGLRLDVTPGIVVGRGGRLGAHAVGYTGSVKLRAYRELVSVKSDVDSAGGEGQRPRWSVGVQVGGELQPLKLAGQVWRGARSVARRVR